MLRPFTRAVCCVPALAFCLLAQDGLLRAQEMPAQRPQGMPQAVPQGQAQTGAVEAPVIPNLTPVPDALLQMWEQKSSQLPKMQGEFVRREYESTFQVVKFAEGEYFYEIPDKGRLELRTPPASKIPTGPVVNQAKNYAPQADVPKVWVCNGAEILDIDPVAKSYNRVQIPEQLRGTRIGEGPLPFLFGMKADRLKNRYTLGLGAFHNPEKMIHIVAYPKMWAEQREFQRAEVLLNPQTFLPTHVKMWDPSGNKETLYQFTKHEKASFSLMNPLSYNLLGYTLLQDAKAPPEGAFGDQRDATGPSPGGRIIR
ncbi:hypothetical protein [Planctomicrobium sp. SH664]|uniref:hypothetical protein n=1 Tax=Planctomicrobium sp. SH664 TaxID=3448125 RepID=UPI003F5C0814